MTTTSKTNSRENTVFEKLNQSSLYSTYRNAFVDATGLGLKLISYDEESDEVSSEYRSEFCALLNQSRSACLSCNHACHTLYQSAVTSGQTISCFAGLRETAIPIRAGGQTVALLTTGQVFTTEPSEQRFREVISVLKENGTTAPQIERLREAWFNTRSLPIKQYEGIITLLSAFAIQLSEFLNRLLVEESHSEPDVVIKAKQFINANLEDKVSLEAVSHHVGVSTFYFCKIFKQTTGMTLTEYVNRRRVERAKRMLLNPQNRVTEVAFEVGYQSLSQFNRSFLRYVGVSPSKYREHETAERSIQRLDAA